MSSPTLASPIRTSSSSSLASPRSHPRKELLEVLTNPVLCFAFREFLQNLPGSRKAEDLLNFFVEVEDFRDEADPEVVCERANTIFQKYLTGSTSTDILGLPPRVKEELQNNISNVSPTTGVFEKVHSLAMLQLTTQYLRMFQMSDNYSLAVQASKTPSALRKAKNTIEASKDMVFFCKLIKKHEPFLLNENNSSLGHSLMVLTRQHSQEGSGRKERERSISFELLESESKQRNKRSHSSGDSDSTLVQHDVKVSGLKSSSATGTPVRQRDKPRSISNLADSSSRVGVPHGFQRYVEAEVSPSSSPPSSKSKKKKHHPKRSLLKLPWSEESPRMRERRRTKSVETPPPSQVTVDEQEKLAKAFRNLLLEPKFCIATAVVKLSMKEEDEELGETVRRNIVLLFREHKKVLPFLRYLFRLEIRGTLKTAANTLLREESAATKVLSIYFFIVGQSYLYDLLHPLVLEIRDASEHLNIDPSVIGVQEAAANVARLLMICQHFLQRVCSSSSGCPTELRRLFMGVKQEVMKRFPTMETSSVGNLFFLRFVCPSIIAPERYNILSEPPSANVRKSLILVSKILQHLVNGVAFEGSYMEQCNEFLSEDSRLMLYNFIDEFTTIDVAEVLHTKATDSELVALNKLREYIVMHFTAVWEVVGAETELISLFREIAEYAMSTLPLPTDAR